MPRVRPGEWSPPLPGESPAAAAPLASAGRGSPRLPGEPPVAAPQGPPRPDPVADAEITTRIPTIPGTPHTPPRKSRRGWWLAGAGVLLAAAAATALILRPWQPTTTPDHVEVSDDRGRVHLTVPTTWAGERQGGGWRPADIGAADDETGPAVAVAEDIDRWRDHQDRTPGVFVGLSGDADVPGLALALRHDGCRAGEATRRAGALSGQVVRWTCPNDVTFDEAGLRTEGGTSVYVQIKQSTRDPDRADEILAGIRII